MSGDPATVPPKTRRELVRFYLLDHRTVMGKAIDIALLVLNLLFVVVFVAETYDISPGIEAFLWDLEVAIATVFLVEYVLRLYGARDRFGRQPIPTPSSI